MQADIQSLLTLVRVPTNADAMQQAGRKCPMSSCQIAPIQRRQLYALHAPLRTAGQARSHSAADLRTPWKRTCFGPAYLIGA